MSANPKVNTPFRWFSPTSISFYLKLFWHSRDFRWKLSVVSDQRGPSRDALVKYYGVVRLVCLCGRMSITNSRSPPKLMSIKSVMPSNHLFLCCPLLLPSIFPSIRVFSKESVLFIRWPKYWSFSFNISSSMNIQDWFPLGLTDFISLQSKGLSRIFSNTTVQKHRK